MNTLLFSCYFISNFGLSNKLYANGPNRQKSDIS